MATGAKLHTVTNSIIRDTQNTDLAKQNKEKKINNIQNIHPRCFVNKQCALRTPTSGKQKVSEKRVGRGGFHVK